MKYIVNRMAFAVLSLLLMMGGGCSMSLEEVYMECKLNIDENRQEVRKTGHYSYRYDSYQDCMRPSRLKQDLEAWEPPESSSRLPNE